VGFFPSSALPIDFCETCGADETELEVTSGQPGYVGIPVIVCTICEAVYDVNHGILLEEGMR
jgi:hypothetical protein